MRIEQMRSAFWEITILWAVATDCQRSFEPASDDASQATDRLEIVFTSRRESQANVFLVLIMYGDSDSIRGVTTNTCIDHSPQCFPDGKLPTPTGANGGT